MSDSADGSVPQQSVEEQFRSLMEGLRTTLPGVQVLVAFLLILPFEQAFDDLDWIQNTAYLVALLSAGASAILLIAPSAHQRVRSASRSGTVPRRHRQHLEVAVRIALIGTAIGAVAITTAIFLAVSIVIGTGPGGFLAAALGALAVWAWFYIPGVTFKNGG